MIGLDVPAGAPIARPWRRSCAYVQRLLVRPLAEAQPLQADRQPGVVHHREHVAHAVVFAADEPADRARRRPSHTSASRGCPSLCSIDTQLAPLRSPSDPSAPTRNFGTRNIEMPFVPGGDPGVRASTRCTMLSATSCSPHVMKIFWPVIAHDAVAERLRLGGDRPDVGAGLRLGEVHRAGPLARHHLGQVGGASARRSRGRGSRRSRPA